MGTIRIEGRSIRIDGREVILRSGEIHYFRIYRKHWKNMLDKARTNHLNTIATYIPWDFHEPQEGMFDFTGETSPERDLISFMNLASSMGLYVIAKPGPFINAEYVDGGHPRWMYRDYPETVSAKPDGSPAFWVGQGNHVPQQLGDRFLERAERWYAQVIPLLAQFSIDNGGPVILHQPDNEMNLLFTGLDPDGSLYDAKVLGNGETAGMFQQRLLERFGSLEALNRRYGTNCASLAAVHPKLQEADAEGRRRLYLDWMRFRMEYVYRYAALLAGWTRKYGLRIPNTYNEPINGFFRGPGNHAAFASYMKEQGEEVLTTCHSYLKYGYHMDANGLPKTVFRLEALKMQAPARPAIAIEVGAGWMTLDQVPNHVNYPVHLRTLLGHGMDGYNYFIFASGEKGFSRTYVTDAYDLFADPVSASGEEHTVYRMTGEFNRFAARWERELAGTAKAYDVVIGLSSDLYLLAQYAGGELAVFEDHSSGASTLSVNRSKQVADSIEALTKMLAMSNIQFALMDLDAPNREHGFQELLIVPNDGTLSEEAMAYIMRHGEKGGRVVFYPEVPVRTPDGRAISLLAEATGFRLRREIPRFGLSAGDIGRRFLRMRELDGIPADQLVTLELPREGRSVIAYEGETSGYRHPFGSGEALVLGFAPQFTGMDNVESLKLLLLLMLPGGRAVYAEEDCYHTVVRGKDGFRLVTAVNMTGVERHDRIRLQLEDGHLQFPKRSRLYIAPLTARMMPVKVRLPYGELVYCTSELVPLDDGYALWEAIGTPGSSGEIAFDRPVRLLADGCCIPVSLHEGLYIGVYSHGLEPVSLKVEAAGTDRDRMI
ncbi:Beta-galactosidase GanA [Paenibacillus sp. UNCCL117]|uniref:beta-galactosidase n=1 Tax=unclassified Paenibacillus TaxID=185978 RepID=UPI000888E1CB|nr:MULTISPECIES: beta-galactosidase [unclassified Paenibacillus]SDC93149.1 Beta-galactosidase GanA [Paenibacillus sp. cl123]SFW29490.1 Beta-galactosidase GanA [Paenibacillus sp. UNCCL117]